MSKTYTNKRGTVCISPEPRRYGVMSYDEIAEALGMSREGVRKAEQRALQKLRPLLLALKEKGQL